MVPAREFTGDMSKPTAVSNWTKLSTRHIAAVIRGRPMSHIVAAMSRRDSAHPTGRLQEMAEAPSFASEAKNIVQQALRNLQEHWSARLSVHVWDRLELSSSKMETLRHLLSFMYKPMNDHYEPIIVWTNPSDPTDRVAAPCLVGRFGREKLFN